MYRNVFQTAQAFAYKSVGGQLLVIVRRGVTGVIVGRFCRNRASARREICRLLVAKLNQPIPTLGGRDGYKVRVRRAGDLARVQRL